MPFLLSEHLAVLVGNYVNISIATKDTKKTTKRFLADLETQNKTLFLRFLLRKAIFCHKNAFFIVTTPSASVQASVSWVSVSSRKKAIKFRSVLMQTWKTQQKNLFRCFFWPKTKFSALQLPFLMLQHLVHPTGRLFCDSEYLWWDTVNFRIVLVRTWKPQKPIFFRPLAQNEYFLHKVAFFVFSKPCTLKLAAAILLNWTSFEWYGKIANCILGVFRKTPKNQFFQQFFWRKSKFIAAKHAIFIVCAPFANKLAAIL